MRFFFSAILFDCEVPQHGSAAIFVVHEAHSGNERFNDVSLLKGSDDQQLNVELLKKSQSERTTLRNSLKSHQERDIGCVF